MCVLCDKQDQRKVVHTQGSVEKPIGIDEEDNVLHSIFNQIVVTIWIGGRNREWLVVLVDLNVTMRAYHAIGGVNLDPLRNQVVSLQHEQSRLS